MSLSVHKKVETFNKFAVHKKFVIDQNVIGSIIFLKITVQQTMSANTVLVYHGIR